MSILFHSPLNDAFSVDFFDDLLTSELKSTKKTKNSKQQFLPQLDVVENDKEYCIQVDLPGVSKDHIDLNMNDNNVLVIKGERKRTLEQSNTDKEHVCERKYGDFERRLQLPKDTSFEEVDAALENGNTVETTHLEDNTGTDEIDEPQNQTLLMKLNDNIFNDKQYEYLSYYEKKSLVFQKEDQLLNPSDDEEEVEDSRNCKTDFCLLTKYMKFLKKYISPTKKLQDKLEEKNKNCSSNLKIFVYPFAPERNINLLKQNGWRYICKVHCISAQFSLDLISHKFFLKSCMRTFNPEEADFYYVPYYSHLDQPHTKSFTKTILDMIDTHGKNNTAAGYRNWEHFTKTDSYWWKTRGVSKHIFVNSIGGWVWGRYDYPVNIPGIWLTMEASHYSDDANDSNSKK
ncbi:Heat shock protein HSP 90-beta [Lobulomyces angularis]|nr:Heat shock protein HSP 90-beta [Lobulomyces angularis]